FEWCVNQPAVDAAGGVYANNEGGFLYAIGRDGKLKQKIFFDQAIGAAYTPLSLDSAGPIYSPDFGRPFVLRNPPRVLASRRPPTRPRAPPVSAEAPVRGGFSVAPTNRVLFPAWFLGALAALRRVRLQHLSHNGPRKNPPATPRTAERRINSRQLDDEKRRR